MVTRLQLRVRDFVWSQEDQDGVKARGGSHVKRSEECRRGIVDTFSKDERAVCTMALRFR
jgi:hypothetical protein